MFAEIEAPCVAFPKVCPAWRYTKHASHMLQQLLTTCCGNALNGSSPKPPEYRKIALTPQTNTGNYEGLPVAE